MAKNKGKVFEEQFKKSCPDYLLIYRPPDAAQGFDVGSSSKLRFSRHSPCDFMLFDGKRNMFWTLELKSFDSTGCSFEKTKDDKNGIIHFYQIESLRKFSKYHRVCSGFILDFRKTGCTYFLDINKFDKMIGYITKKSFNEKDLFQYCNPLIINKKKLRTNYKYDIEKFLTDTSIYDDVMEKSK